MCLQSDCGLLALDFDFAGKPAESLINFTKLESSPAGITAVGKSSTVWKAVLKVEYQWRISNIKDCTFLNDRIFQN